MSHRSAKKSLGQNFLVDDNIAEKIVACAGVTEDDVVVEIGPGRGILTRLLAARAGRLIAIELDNALAQKLKEEFAFHKRVTIEHADFLKTELSDYASGAQGRIKLIGNIPYNLSGPIIFKALDFYETISEMILMLQREVARRVVAGPGTKEYGLLAIRSQALAHTKLLFNVSAHVFRPRPKVTSAVVRWEFPERPKYTMSDSEFFARVLKTAFAQRRKKLRNSLKEIFAEAPYEGTLLNKRPEELSVVELVEFCETLWAYGRKRSQRNC